MSIDAHTCVGLLCDRLVDRQWCLCATHFKLVPEGLRAPLLRAYNRYRTIEEQSPGFFMALAQVNGWIKSDAEVNEKPRADWDRVVAMVRARDAARAERRRETVKARAHLTLVP